jgi:N-acetyl-gamma-glutamyl-phosphate reductase
MDQAVPVAVVGASGYTGAELLRLLAVHPHVRIAGVYAKRAAGERLPSIFPQFAGRLDLEIRAFDAAEIASAGVRVAFCALPHGESAPIVAQLYGKGLTVLDLSADLRLHDPAAYKEWYGHDPSPLCTEAVYGIPELARRDLKGVRLFACPGCYPTASLLALAPLVDAGLVAREGLIIDAKSGVSGAGRAATQSVHFSEIGEGVRAYKVAGAHRHTPEIEQGLGARGIIFTPHLLPMTRGILATCYGTPTDPARPAAAYRDALAKWYAGKAFVSMVDAPPDTAHVRGSNRAHVFATYDTRARRVIAMCAIDNLTKGASGQAIQCMNLALGLPETAGLDGVGMFP